MGDIRNGRPPREASAAAGPGPAARPGSVARPRPDARPLRIAFGMGAVAAASALVTALASPPAAGATPAGAAPAEAQTIVTLPAPTPGPVRHVTQYIQLKPGQTAPPKAVVKQAPAPKPRVVIVTTRQSGAKP